MINLNFFNPSDFKEKVLEECPTMQYGASFIKYIAYFQILISFAAGWFLLPSFNLDIVLLNTLSALLFSLIHLLIIKLLDHWLHEFRKWSILFTIALSILLIAFLQTIFIGNHLFKTELEIDPIIRQQHIPNYWVSNLLYYMRKLFFIFSFQTRVVTNFSIALFIVASFIGMLPFALTFFYRKSKYYPTQKLIEKFRIAYEQISKK